MIALTALVWAASARGAFFRTGLFGFAFLAVGAAAAALIAAERVGAMRWWTITVLPVICAIVASATATHSLAAAPYALAPVVAAVALGVVGSLAEGRARRALLLYLVVGVATVMAVLGILGVLVHWSRFAAPLSDGWRATGSLGDANMTGVVLLVGLVCAAALASGADRRADRLCCWALATGLLATQSRGALIASALCWLLLFVVHRPMARIVASSAAWASITFVVLLPSVRSQSSPRPVVVVAAVTVMAGAWSFWHRSFWHRSFWQRTRGRGSRRATITFRCLVAGASAVAVVALRGRIFDGGSDQGRIRLWGDGLSHVRANGWFGQGPQLLANLSRGHIGPLLAHNDPLQFIQFYGALAAVAMVWLGLRLVASLRSSYVRPGAANGWPEGAAEMWAAAVASLAAVAVVMAVDFPLQVPLIPALMALVVGATVQPGTRRDQQPATVERVRRVRSVRPTPTVQRRGASHVPAAS